MASDLRTPRVAIIGAGQSGIGMAVKLREAGVDSFRIYEKRDGIGGTWHANTYPGLFCDVPSRHYQYSFALNPDWSQIFPPGAEIQRYIEGVANERGIVDRISFATEVEELRWVDDHWTLRTTAGEQAEYDFVITACGALVHPRTPEIPGLDTFAGDRCHSAEWDPSITVKGRRVGVIGTGSTGMQLTRAIAPVASKFELYQRTPQWILPLVNTRYTPLGRALMRRFPGLNKRAYRFYQVATEGSFGTAVVKAGWQRHLLTAMCKAHLRSVRDPQLRARFTPKDKPMCKRLVMGGGFYNQFKRPNVELIDTGIDHIEERGIVTSDGVLHELDVIVTATGFHTNRYVLPLELIGPGEQRLTDKWDPQPHAYRTVAVPGFPNVLMLIGPHSPFGNQSLFRISETQAGFALKLIERWRAGEFDAIAPTQAATDRFNAELKAQIPQTIWSSGCSSWYIGADGTPAVWPWSASHHAEVLRDLEPGDWDLTPVREPVG